MCQCKSTKTEVFIFPEYQIPVLSLVIYIKLYNYYDLKTILLSYINLSTKQVIPPPAVLVKSSMFTLSKFYNSVPLLYSHFPPQSVIPPERWLVQKTTIGVLYIQFSSIASFPLGKITIQQDFPPKKWLYSGIFPPEEWLCSRISPLKNDYILVPL